MKNKEFREISPIKSFRAKIILYSLLSLVYTILTETAFFLVVRLVVQLSRSFSGSEKLSGAAKPQAALSEAIQGLSDATKSVSEAGVQAKLGEQASTFLPDRPPGGAYFAFFIAVALLLGIILFILYFLLLSRRMTGYLSQIVAGIKKMSEGDFTARITIEDEDEFACIGNQLNNMADSIAGLMEQERKNEKIKNDLITNVAHDLRTPLTSVIGYLDLVIKNDSLEKDTRKHYIQIAYDKALRLQSLIGDLFNFTKANTGEMVCKKAPIDIVRLMEQMVEEFYPAFEEAHLTCEFLADCDSAVVEGDGELLARAFSNLIGNAVKYGRDGKLIKIWVHKTKRTVCVSVLNYGEIIPKESLEHIFDRFYRVESSRSEETGGSGLGLAIARKIVEMHEGSLTAESGLDGTVFKLKLKLKGN